MEWPEYILTVKDQIRNKKAKNLIEDELKDHLEEQIKAYQEQGLDAKESEKKAVLDLGDPVEVGTEFNRVHRPKLERNLIIMIAIFGALSLLVNYFYGIDYRILEREDYFLQQVIYSLIGITAMVLIYYFDYTIIGKYPLVLWCVLYILGIFYVEFGRWHYETQLYLFHIVYLFVPIFAGVLFRFRQWKGKGLILSGLIGASPLALTIIGHNWSAFVHYSIIFILMMNIAVIKRWFNISRKLGFFLVWSGMIGTLSGGFILQYVSRSSILSSYQRARLQALFTWNDDMMYTPNLVKNAIVSSKLIGKNTEMVNQISSAGSDYMLVYIMNTFGILIGAAVIALLIAFVYKALKLAKKQRSYLGFMVGMACALSIMVQGMFYIASNLGLYQVSMLVAQQRFPFLSSGGSNIVYSYAIVGLLLSVYRNSELISDGRIRSKKVKFQKIKS